MKKSERRYTVTDVRIFGKIPPQNLEMEKVVLGAIMLESSAFERVSDLLKAETFYLESHKEIFQSMSSLAANNSPIDLLTVVESLKKSGKLDGVGGPYYISTLTNNVVSSASIESHSRIIHQKYLQREIGRIAGDLYAESFDDATDGLDLLEKADKLFLEVGGSTYRSSVQNMQTVMTKTMEKIEYYRTLDTAITGVPSGFNQVDRATRGWQDGDLIIIAARPSTGKTAFALNLAINAAKEDRAVGIWSLEMDAVSQGTRMLSAESRAHMLKLQTGKISSDELQEIYNTPMKRLMNLPVFFDDNSDLTLTKLRSSARRLVKKHGMKLLIVDYLQLMQGEEKRSNREQEISKISRGLKNLAKELKIPVIALSQLSRDVEKRKDNKPMLADIRESGSIEQDADVVIFLYGENEEARRDDASLENVRHIRIAKQRNGTLLDTNLDFDASIQLFTDPKVQWKKVDLSEPKQADLPF
jgi:replicative DNA helicase